jgi:hypothetical protein
MIPYYLHFVGSEFRRVAAILLCLACFLGFAVAPAFSARHDENFFTHLHTDKVMANVTVSPGRAGPVNIMIQLETVDELPLVARAVLVTLTDAQSGIKLEAVQAERTGEDRWLVKVAALTAGRWMLGLGISISDSDKISVQAPILIASEAIIAESATKHHRKHAAAVETRLPVALPREREVTF